MKKILFSLLFTLFSTLCWAQSGPRFISANLNAESYHPGDQAVLTIFKLAQLESNARKVVVEGSLTFPDTTELALNLKEITNEVVMGISSTLDQQGEYLLTVKAYFEDEAVTIPLKSFIEVNRKRICKIELLLEIEHDPIRRQQLENEKSERQADIEIAKIQLAANRQELQEVKESFNVSSNLPPRILGEWPAHLTNLYVQIESQFGNVINVLLCSNLPIQDPEDGSEYDWNIDFGDGNEVTFHNKLYHPDGFQDFGCVEHSYLKNTRPKVTYTAIDKNGASFSFSQILDLRKNVKRPIPNLKVSSFQKMMVDDGNGNQIPAVKVTYDPFNTRIPSDSGMFIYRMFPQGRCANFDLCPDYHNQQVPLNYIEHTYTFSGNFSMQYTMRDNLQFMETSRIRFNLNLDNVSENPSQTEIDAMFGPAAMIQVDRNNVEITDFNTGVEIKFDGTGSYDLSGDDSKLEYYWDFGDLHSGYNFDNKKKTSHVYKTPGYYYAYLTVRDEHGNTSIRDWVYIRVTHKSQETAPVEFYAFRSSSSDNSFMFSVDSLATMGLSAGLQFYWDYGDGTHDTSGFVVSKTYDEPGTYDVKVTFQDYTGKFVTLSKTIDTTNPMVSPEVGHGIWISDLAFIGQPVMMSADSAGNDFYSRMLFWNFGEGQYISGDVSNMARNVNYKAKGIKNISLIHTNTAALSSEVSFTLPVVQDAPEITSIGLTNLGSDTQVDFSVTHPVDPSNIKRIEITNFAGGWAAFEQPLSNLDFSSVIRGIGSPVMIIITDINGNQRPYWTDLEEAPAPREHNFEFPISDIKRRQIDRAIEYISASKEQARM